MLRIVKIGEADYPMSVNLSTVDGSAVGEFIDIIGGEGKLISLGGTVMPETYVTIHEQIGHNAQKCENMQHHNFGTTMGSELVLGMTVIEGEIYKQKQARSLLLLPFRSYGASKFVKNQPDFTRGCLITCNTMPTYCT